MYRYSRLIQVGLFTESLYLLSVCVEQERSSARDSFRHCLIALDAHPSRDFGKGRRASDAWKFIIMAYAFLISGMDSIDEDPGTSGSLWPCV